MKVNIYEDEWYPVHSIDTYAPPEARTIEVPDEFVERYERVMGEFEELQVALYMYLSAAR